jgi:hypothetical protein
MFGDIEPSHFLKVNPQKNFSVLSNKRQEIELGQA